MPMLRRADSAKPGRGGTSVQGRASLVQRKLPRSGLHRKKRTAAAVTPTDRDRIVEMLLEDPPPSCRAVSRATGYSDWTIRKIARELDGDPRPMKRQHTHSYETPDESADVSPVVSWLIFGGFLVVLAAAIWAGVRYVPPLDSTAFRHGFYPNLHAERMDNETEFPE